MKNHEKTLRKKHVLYLKRHCRETVILRMKKAFLRAMLNSEILTISLKKPSKQILPILETCTSSCMVIMRTRDQNKAMA